MRTGWRDTRGVRHLRLAAGSLLAGVGVAAIIYGGITAATGPGDGSHPHELAGLVLCLIGLGLMTLGLWLAGVDLT